MYICNVNKVFMEIIENVLRVLFGTNRVDGQPVEPGQYSITGNSSDYHIQVCVARERSGIYSGMLRHGLSREIVATPEISETVGEGTSIIHAKGRL